MNKQEVVTCWECVKCGSKHEDTPTKRDGTRYCPTCLLRYSVFTEVKEKKFKRNKIKVKVKGRDKWI